MWFISILTNNANTMCETLKEGPKASLKKEEPEATASFVSPNVHPCLGGSCSDGCSPRTVCSA